MAGNHNASGVSAAVAPPNSFGSVVVNGQLVGAQTTGAYYPKNYGGGVSATPAGSPVTIPPSVGYGMSASSSNNTPIPSGSGTAALPGGFGSTSSSVGNRGNYTGPVLGSPAMWAFGLMAFGILWLRFVHWRKPSRRGDE